MVCKAANNENKTEFAFKNYRLKHFGIMKGRRQSPLACHKCTFQRLDIPKMVILMSHCLREDAATLQAK